MYNFVSGEEAILLNNHLAAYDGSTKFLTPKPSVAILGASGRANLDGRPSQGSAAEFLTKQTQWPGEPSNISFCLHDTNLIKPYTVNTTEAKTLIEKETSGKAIDT